VNNSIGKHSETFAQIVNEEVTGQPIEGFMWDCHTFGEYIVATTGQDLFWGKIQPRMKKMAAWALMCAVDMVQHRKSSWELYGYDFMIDDHYQV
jgi:tubulin monoglycylase TTLL3/8